MASKNIIVFIDGAETNTVIRRIKKKEFKDLVIKLAAKGDELTTLFGKPDIVSALPDVIGDNIDFICNEAILPYTKLTEEQLDDMDMVDILDLGRELLEYNRIDMEKVINFLKPGLTAGQKITETLNFNGVTIPS